MPVGNRVPGAASRGFAGRPAGRLVLSIPCPFCLFPGLNLTCASSCHGIACVIYGSTFKGIPSKSGHGLPVRGGRLTGASVLLAPCSGGRSGAWAAGLALQDSIELPVLRILDFGLARPLLSGKDADASPRPLPAPTSGGSGSRTGSRSRIWSGGRMYPWGSPPRTRPTAAVWPQLVSASGDRTLRIWDALPRAERLAGPPGP